MDLFTSATSIQIETPKTPNGVKGNIPFTPFVSEYPKCGGKPFLPADKAIKIMDSAGLQLGKTTWGWVCQEDLHQTAAPCFRGRKWQKHCYLPLFTAAELEQILPVAIEVSDITYSLRYVYTHSSVIAAYVNGINVYCDATGRGITAAMTSMVLMLIEKGIDLRLPDGTDFSPVYNDGGDKIVEHSSPSVYANGVGNAELVKPSDLPQTEALLPIGEIEMKPLIDDVFKRFGLEAKYVTRTRSASLITYEYRCSGKTSIANIKARESDIAIELKTSGCRVIAMKGKNTIGVEIPKNNRDIVHINTLLSYSSKDHDGMKIPLILGKDSMNTLVTLDLAAAPHLLVAGSTNTGKSVGLNVIIKNLLYRFAPDEIKLLLIDPKKVELSLFEGLDNYLLQFSYSKVDGKDNFFYKVEQGVITETLAALQALKILYGEMLRRYALLKAAGVRNISEYNSDTTNIIAMPLIVAVIDEFASLSSNKEHGKEIMAVISQLAALARATGIHLILATQSPYKEVITGVIKNNFTTRIAFRVPMQANSSVILGHGGAEVLTGNGDALLMVGADIDRFQCAYISTDEVKTLVTEAARKPYHEDIHSINVNEAWSYGLQG